MNSIDTVYSLVKFVANKEQRGEISPDQYNNLAKIAQNEVIAELIGPLEFDQNRVPKYGYRMNRRISETLRPLVYGPVTIPISQSGNFDYPYGFIWPDAIHKTDFTPIREIWPDQYPHIKHSQIIGPTVDYPILIWRNPYGFIDPYNIGNFSMSYVKRPPDPYWAYDEVNDEPVYNPSLSVQFALQDVFSTTRIAMKILGYLGINLDAAQVTQYAELKNQQGV